MQCVRSVQENRKNLYVRTLYTLYINTVAKASSSESLYTILRIYRGGDVYTTLCLNEHIYNRCFAQITLSKRLMYLFYYYRLMEISMNIVQSFV